MKTGLKFIIEIVLVFFVGVCGGFAGYELADRHHVDNEVQITTTTTTEKNDTPISEVASKTANSVVEIRTETATTNFFMQEFISEGAGSGVIISKDGYVITNNHVIEGANKVTVRTAIGDEYEAKLIGTDSQNDIAVIKIEAEDLSAATVGDSSNLVVGENVVAIGNPLGELGGTVTQGIISATSRQVTIDGQQLTVLQTDAAINPGNSGGGLFNMQGELIGIVNAKSSGSDIEGLGFAIPSNTAISISQELMDQGFVSGNYTVGVSILEITSENEARSYGVDKTGLYIVRIVEGSDAEKAGLKSGDRIVTINGKEATDFEMVRKMIKNSKSKDVIVFVVERDNKEMKIQVQVR